MSKKSPFTIQITFADFLLGVHGSQKKNSCFVGPPLAIWCQPPYLLHCQTTLHLN